MHEAWDSRSVIAYTGCDDGSVHIGSGPDYTEGSLGYVRLSRRERERDTHTHRASLWAEEED